MRPGTKAESRPRALQPRIRSAFTLSLLLSLAPSRSSLPRSSSFYSFPALFFWPFFVAWARNRRYRMACTRERTSFNFFSPPRLTVRYIGARHWKPHDTWCDAGGDGDQTRPNLPLFPPRDRNTRFSKGCMPPLPSYCATPQWSRVVSPPRNCSRRCAPDDDQSEMGVFLRPKRSI